MSPEQFQAYLEEFTFPFNRRRSRRPSLLIESIATVLGAVGNITLRWKTPEARELNENWLIYTREPVLGDFGL